MKEYHFPHYDDSDPDRDEFLFFTVRELIELGESWDEHSALTYAKEQWAKGERL